MDACESLRNSEKKSELMALIRWKCRKRKESINIQPQKKKKKRKRTGKSKKKGKWWPGRA